MYFNNNCCFWLEINETYISEAALVSIAVHFMLKITPAIHMSNAYEFAKCSQISVYNRQVLCKEQYNGPVSLLTRT